MYGPFTAVVSINEQPLTSLRSASKVRTGTRTHTWSILKIRHAYSRGQLSTWMHVAYFTVRNRTACIFLYFWTEQFPTSRNRCFRSNADLCNMRLRRLFAPFMSPELYTVCMPAVPAMPVWPKNRHSRTELRLSENRRFRFNKNSEPVISSARSA